MDASARIKELVAAGMELDDATEQAYREEAAAKPAPPPKPKAKPKGKAD